MRSAKRRKTERWHLPPRTGALCWQRKVNRRPHKKPLEKLCRIYWRPLYGFVRRQGLGPEDAQDLIQEFFARLLERQNLKTVRREKGRLRSYLLVSIKRFLTSERHRASGVKRYETGPSIPLDELLAYEGTEFE